MDELVNEVEGIESFETDEETFETEKSEGFGILGKVVGGAAAMATGVAIGCAIKNKDKIAEGWKNHREQKAAERKAKKVAKHLSALEKLGWGETETTEK